LSIGKRLRRFGAPGPASNLPSGDLPGPRPSVGSKELRGALVEEKAAKTSAGEGGGGDGGGREVVEERKRRGGEREREREGRRRRRRRKKRRKRMINVVYCNVSLGVDRSG
jgi:hypothetical protein